MITNLVLDHTKHSLQQLPRRLLTLISILAAALLIPGLAMASEGASHDFTNHWVGITCVIIFVVAYALVIGEEALHLRKSKPVIIAAGLIWGFVAFAYMSIGDTHTAGQAVRHNLLEFAELFLFLLAAMTFINTMEERGVFNVLRVWLVSQGFSLRTIFWMTGALAFVISPIADNLTTALLMATVAMAVGGKNTAFVMVACINIVVAANAGGAFSPFGDITTLMVWQKGIIPFQGFFVLFLPSLVNWLIPAVIMSFSVPKEQPDAVTEVAELRHGAWFVVGLFIVTIAMAVSAHNFLHMPPVLGMMTGLGLLKLFGYYLKKRSYGADVAGLSHAEHFPDPAENNLGEHEIELDGAHQTIADASEREHYNIFKALERAEWDTLMFFYGIILCVGGLGSLGYLALGSELMYGDLGATNANILVGVLSALVDNIPVMFAVLSMSPDMSHGQWLLVTLTAGVGGSLLSIGSAAGVAVMGQARGIYTFFGHMKWSWAIGLGYAASIWVHFLVNADAF
ncbi:MAG TPA: sodium:proton antiporter [Chromatiaceae bacterium]|jgi:Na+/H+ antiporter NhaD/arsenite permease-like protein|nr:sodium:proton antiporter [Chromatiaceae bacterium]HIB84985.1 sodium:proton antiporter [Chromatiaceae bacterium]HIO14702.1 sodium:proton antiporter [Chromatiales bacterium]